MRFALALDVAFLNGRLVLGDSIVEASIGVKDGRIAIVVDGPLTAEETVDLGGRHVLPGLIDAHVHFRDPAFPEWEDFDSGSAAAAAGGVTTFFEMPPAQVGIVTADLLVERARTVQPRARTDFALFAGATHHNLDEIPRLAEAGAVAFKTYLIKPYDTRAVNFSRLSVENEGQMLAAWEAVAKTGLVAAAHCENQSVIDYMTEQLKAAGRTDPLAATDSRPPVAEVEAVSRAIVVARQAGAPLHIVHLTTAGALEAVTRARAAGQRVTCEATPPHLFYTRQHVVEEGPYGLHVPPLREEADVRALWQGLKRGDVAYIATDHAGFSDPAVKEIGWQDPWQAKAGDSLLESMLPLLLTEVNAGRLTLGEVARYCSEGPARVHGLYPRKGALQVGSDADLTIVDLDQEFAIDPDSFYSRGKATSRAFKGWKCKGRPVMTVVRGRMVMRDGVVVGPTGWGEWIKPADTARAVEGSAAAPA